jgi:hypothetical protein
VRLPRLSGSTLDGRMTGRWIVTAVAATAMVAHLALWLYAAGFPPYSECGEISCWTLIAADLPVSLAYVGPTAKTVTLGSATIGTLWWGLVAAGISRWVLRKVRGPQRR